MAANIMELLKQIQRDLAEQKEYMRNLHVVHKDLNEKCTLVEAKLTNVDKKLDQQDIRQQQVLESVEKLVQQVKINNKVLFGSEDTEIEVGCIAAVSNNSILNPIEKLGSPDNIETTLRLELGNSPAVELNKDTELKIANKINTEDHFYKTENHSDRVDIISNEIKEMKNVMNDFVALTQSLMEDTSTRQHRKCNTAEISSTNADSVIRTFDDKLNQITDLYTSDMKDLRESIKHLEKTIKESIEKTSSAVRQPETVQAFSNYFSIEQINQLNAELKRVTDMNHSDIEEVIILMKNFIGTIKMSVKQTADIATDEDTVLLPSTFITEQFNLFNVELLREAGEIKKLIIDCNSNIETISKISNECVKKNSISNEKSGQVLSTCTELKQITEVNKSNMEEVKTLIKDIVRKLHIEEVVKLSAKQKTIQISPTYFSPDQMSKLNSELKSIAENYQDTNVLSIIEVIPGSADEHPVMKHLRKGVYYAGIFDEGIIIKFKLGWNGLKRSDIIDLITEYPDLSLYEVIRAWKKSSSGVDNWSVLNTKYNMKVPLTIKDGKYVPL